MPVLQIEGSAPPAAIRRTVLGLDPGTQVLGYGVVAQDCQGKLHLLTLGSIPLSKLVNHYARLGHIYARVLELVQHYQPTEVAIEAPFFGKNAQSMLKLGRAQGVAIAAAMSTERVVVEYAPRRIKQAITGQGDASKEQVAFFLQQMFPAINLGELAHYDATDGLAAAVCHLGQKLASGPKRSTSWEDYVQHHPERLKS